jgi:YD repeat-containing protein
LQQYADEMGSQTITQYSYGYDNNGNITSVTENGRTTNYPYALNRLTGIQRPGGRTDQLPVLQPGQPIDKNIKFNGSHSKAKHINPSTFAKRKIDDC